MEHFHIKFALLLECVQLKGRDLQSVHQEVIAIGKPCLIPNTSLQPQFSNIQDQFALVFEQCILPLCLLFIHWHSRVSDLEIIYTILESLPFLNKFLAQFTIENIITEIYLSDQLIIVILR